MAIKKTYQKLSNSLHFRILAPIVPIIILMVLLGSAIFSLGLRTISHYADEHIVGDLERRARDVYSICDTAMQSLILDGYTDMQAIGRIRKGNTLGKIEEYARQQNLHILVIEGEEKKVLLDHTDVPAQTILSKLHAADEESVTRIFHSDQDYYVRQTDFELWNWRIILLKDGKTYSEFFSKITHSYYAIGAIVLITTLLLILYFRRMIHNPVRAIISSVQKNGMPEYKGIYEFEFLSNVIRDAAVKEREKQAEMSYQASHDELTGLANRREFERRLTNTLNLPKLPCTEHTILYLDLDQFKIINDTSGHHAGDALLQQVTKIMKDKLRQSDLLARLGGDEFGVLLENCSGEAALRIAEDLRQVISEFRFGWSEKIFTVGVSIGLVTFGQEEGALNDLLSAADSACYIAKDRGRNRIHVHRADDSALMERNGQMNWITRISEALEKDLMVLYQQKIVPLQEPLQDIEHFEVLLRMQDRNGGLIPPSSFLPAAERYNLMPEIDKWVIKKSFKYCRDLYSAQGIPFLCSINLSGATIGDEKLIGFIEQQFRTFNIAPNSICFEVTETAAIGNINSAAALIRTLKEIGCRFALDDFGSGMSSFGYLKHLPVDFLKIDGGFVKNMLHDQVDLAMVTAINNLGHVMGLQTVAEFVEDESIRAKLKAIGIDHAQGFGIGHPEPFKRSRKVRNIDDMAFIDL